MSSSVNLTLIQKDLKYWHYFHPFWLYLLMCPRKETMNLIFVENLVGLRVYPTVYRISDLAQMHFSIVLVSFIM